MTNQSTTPTPIVDKNGKQTTVHKKTSAVVNAARIPATPAVPTEDVFELPYGSLSTAQLEEVTALVPYPKRAGNSQEEKNAWIAARREYDLTIGQLEHQWSQWLHDTHAENLPRSVQEDIFRKAWEDGHSSGYNSVESEYEDLAGFATKIAEAVRKES